MTADSNGAVDAVTVEVRRADGTVVTATPDTVTVQRADGTVVTGTSSKES